LIPERSFIPRGGKRSSDISKRRGFAPGAFICRALLAATVGLACLAGGSLSGQEGGYGVLLPDGREFISWEKPLQFTRTYYVDNRNPRASDSNPGTKELPLMTINRAAQALQPGERVAIRE